MVSESVHSVIITQCVCNLLAATRILSSSGSGSRDQAVAARGGGRGGGGGGEGGGGGVVVVVVGSSGSSSRGDSSSNSSSSPLAVLACTSAAARTCASSSLQNAKQLWYKVTAPYESKTPLPKGSRPSEASRACSPGGRWHLQDAGPSRSSTCMLFFQSNTHDSSRLNTIMIIRSEMIERLSKMFQELFMSTRRCVVQSYGECLSGTRAH